MSTSPSTDPMRVYLDQIGRHPLLTPAEEARLSRERVRQAERRALRELSRDPALQAGALAA